jgi:hypothetical protein
MGPVSGGDSWLPGVGIQPRLICFFLSMFGVVNCHVVDGVILFIRGHRVVAIGCL